MRLLPRTAKLPSPETLRRYADPLGTLIVAIVFAVLAALDVVDAKTARVVTLGVLAAVAGTMLRQRSIVEEVKTSADRVPDALQATNQALAKVNRTIDAITSSDAYELLEHESEWDIANADGSLAYGKKRKHLRFNQHNVVAIYEVSHAWGGDEARVGNWEFEPEEIKTAGNILIGDQDYLLLGLGRRYGRNDELAYTSKRVIRDLFVDERNAVSHRVQERTHHLCLRVRWANDGVPARVRVEEEMPGEQQSKIAELDGTTLPREDGRPFLERSYDQPPRGQKVTIVWWPGPASASPPQLA